MNLNLFLHSNSSFDTSLNVRLILAPEHYWVRVFELGIQKIKDVYDVLPTLFEEFIDISDKKFYVKKVENKENMYLCFAYDEEKIIESIKKSNLRLSQISTIHFAQIEFQSLISPTVSTCMKLDNICLGYMNDTLVQVPIQLRAKTDNDIDLDKLKLSNHTIQVSRHSKYITSKNSYILYLFLIDFH